MKSLNEFKIGSLKKTIKIDIDIEATKHAIQRQTRHGADKVIELEEVKFIVDESMDKLINLLIKDEIDISKDRVLLVDNYTKTNVVGILEPKSSNYKFVVITLYRGSDFKTGRNQKIITINEKH